MKCYVLLFLILAFSYSANSATITYYNYTLDTDTNIVTDGNLQWLQWDETKGMSVNEALAAYSTDGWRVANSTEMTALLNNFPFGITFDEDSTVHTSNSLYDEILSYGLANQFIELFGNTSDDPGTSINGDQYEMSAAFYVSKDSRNWVNRAYVYDEWSRSLEPGAEVLPGRIVHDQRGPYGTGYTNTSYSSTGVALVRGGVVPVPAAAWLFGTALVGLAGIKRKKQ